MTVLAAVLGVLSTLVTLVWVSRHLMIQRQKNAEVLSPASPGLDGDAPFVSVMVAAKDEAENIETCLRTLLAQDYPNFEVIAVNDRSDDDTGAMIDRLAAEDERLRAIHIEELPEGWCGKNNAMAHAVAEARGDWLCMTDADCSYASGHTLSAAVRYAHDKQADLLSILPKLEMHGFWERVIQPVCSGVMMIWFHPDKVNNPDKPNAYANGAFMLMRREAYEAVGGHAAVRDRVNEDMHMADHVKRQGLRLRVVTSKDLYSVRMYESLGAILRGWSRIFFGTFGTLKRLTLSLTVMLVMGLLPYAAAVLGFAAVGAGWQPTGLWWFCGVAGAAAVVMQISVIFRYYRLLEGSPILAWTYPIACGIVSGILLRSLSKLRPGAKVTWRGTSYSS
ncbi:MAG: glycosyltransferase [Phycisphaerae bacterium]